MKIRILSKVVRRGKLLVPLVLLPPNSCAIQQLWTIGLIYIPEDVFCISCFLGGPLFNRFHALTSWYNKPNAVFLLLTWRTRVFHWQLAKLYPEYLIRIPLGDSRILPMRLHYCCLWPNHLKRNHLLCIPLNPRNLYFLVET